MALKKRAAKYPDENGRPIYRQFRRAAPVSMTMTPELFEKISERMITGNRSATMSAHIKRYYDLVAVAALPAIEKLESVPQLLVILEILARGGLIKSAHEVRHLINVDVSDSWARHGAGRLATLLLLEGLSDLDLLGILDLAELFWTAQATDNSVDPVEMARAICPHWKALARAKIP